MGEPRRVGLDLDHFVMRLLTDALNEATRTYWEKRAADFRNARPRLDEHYGNATLEQVRDQWHRLTEIANACSARAQLAPLDDIHPDVERVWGETA